jgi:hypothetical protein
MLGLLERVECRAARSSGFSNSVDGDSLEAGHAAAKREFGRIVAVFYDAEADRPSCFTPVGT